MLTRTQVACILSLAFFGALAPPPEKGFQQLTLTFILTNNFLKSQRSKLLCLLTYFDRLRQAESKDEEFLSLCISVQRRQIQKQASAKFWGECELLLSPFSSVDGLIEESHGDLQVDFANEYIGGGVLNMGNVQVSHSTN